MRDEVHVRHILIKPSAIRSDEEARLLVQRLRDRINAGEDFALSWPGASQRTRFGSQRWRPELDRSGLAGARVP